MWPFTKKPRTKNSSFAVGPYSIDTAVDGIPGLREATDEEYAAYGRRFSEEFSTLHEQSSSGFKWKMLLATVNSRIYKVAPYIETTDKQMANRVAFMTMGHLQPKHRAASKTRNRVVHMGYKRREHHSSDR